MQCFEIILFYAQKTVIFDKVDEQDIFSVKAKGV